MDRAHNCKHINKENKKIMGKIFRKSKLGNKEEREDQIGKMDRQDKLFYHHSYISKNDIEICAWRIGIVLKFKNEGGCINSITLKHKISK